MESIEKIKEYGAEKLEKIEDVLKKVREGSVTSVFMYQDNGEQTYIVFYNVATETKFKEIISRGELKFEDSEELHSLIKSILTPPEDIMNAQVIYSQGQWSADLDAIKEEELVIRQADVDADFHDDQVEHFERK